MSAWRRAPDRFGYFRSIEAPLDQVFCTERQNSETDTPGQKGFEAWHSIVRRYDQRIMSGKQSACAALISNISERARAKDVEQSDDILRTFINETNTFESTFGTITDEEKMFVVRKMVPDLLCCFRF